MQIGKLQTAVTDDLRRSIRQTEAQRSMFSSDRAWRRCYRGLFDPLYDRCRLRLHRHLSEALYADR